MMMMRGAASVLGRAAALMGARRVAAAAASPKWRPAALLAQAPCRPLATMGAGPGFVSEGPIGKPQTRQQKKVGSKVMNGLQVALSAHAPVYDLLVRRMGLSFTEVRMSHDNRIAYIRWTNLTGGDRAAGRVERELNKVAGRLKAVVGRNMGTKHVPRLEFRRSVALPQEEELETAFQSISSRDGPLAGFGLGAGDRVDARGDGVSGGAGEEEVGGGVVAGAAGLGRGRFGGVEDAEMAAAFDAIQKRAEEAAAAEREPHGRHN